MFTNEEIKLLSNNKYIKNVTAKAITYTDEFKTHFIAKRSKGKLPIHIFQDAGFDSALIFKIIHNIVSKYGHKNMIFHLCKIVEVSRSGYYNYLN